MTLHQETEQLRRIPLFANIEPSKLKLLAFTSERLAFEPGQVMFRQGDVADAAYIVIEGEAEVVVDSAAGPLTIARLGRDAVLGEIGILCDVPRTAMVRAATRLVTLRISKELFLRLINQFPMMAVAIMRELAHRLEATNDQLRSTLAEVERLRRAAG